MVLRSDPGGDAVTLYDGPADHEISVVHVAVQPGSTSEDLTVVFTRFGEGTYEVSYVTIRDHGQPVIRSSPDRYPAMPDVPSRGGGGPRRRGRATRLERRAPQLRLPRPAAARGT